MLDNFFYVLGWPQPSGKVAILCRSKGREPGPAYCWTKREAIHLRTKLANDRRGAQNPCANNIIRQLLVYKYLSHKPLPSRPGDLWVYSAPHLVESVEATPTYHNNQATVSYAKHNYLRTRPVLH